MAKIKLYESKKKTNAQVYPKPKDVFVNPRGTKDKLQPYLRLDGGLLRPEWAGKTFHWILWEIGVSPLSFKCKGAQCIPVEDPSELDDTTELEDNPKSIFVSLDPESVDELEYHSTWHYDPQGNLTKLHGPDTQFEHRFQWGTVDGKSLPRKMETFSRHFDKPILQRWTFDHQPDGFLGKLAFERPAIDFAFHDGFTFTDEPDGLILAQGIRRKDLSLLIHPDGTYQFDRDDNWESKRNPLSKIAPNYKSFVSEGFLREARHILRQRTDQFDYAEELHPSGMVQSMSWTYRREATHSELEFSYERTEDGLRVLRNGKPWYVLKLLGEVLEAQPAEGRSYFFPKAKDPREVVMELVTDNFLLFMQDQRFDTTTRIRFPDALPHRPQQFHIDYKHHTDGSVKQRKLSLVTTHAGREICELWTAEDLRWDQYEETPYDEAGNEMALVGQLQTGDVFGSYYLFYSEAEDLMTIVFQCT